jgi:hypothetical protein
MPAITFRCRTPQCPNWISFHSDDYLPKDWTCPACLVALEDQMLDDLAQREIARDLVKRAEAKERESR